LVILLRLNEIANKVDLVTEDPSKREVKESEAKEFAEENKLLYMGETSALSDINVKEVAEGLIQCKKEKSYF
jgi:predicted dinucleotide-utilizing enzyme